MANTVFVLGAGASKSCGAPLMAEFLDVARSLSISSEWAENRHFEKVFRAIGALQQVHSKADLDIVNVESVFAALEMGHLLGKFPGYSSREEILEAIESFKHVIVETLESSVSFPGIHRGRLMGPWDYQQFCSLINSVPRQNAPRHTVSIITFNYDIAVEVALYASGNHVEYCLDRSVGPQEKVVKVLKLHGSLNWGQCSVCGQILPWDIAEALSSVSPPLEGSGPDVRKIRVGRRIGSLPGHCEKPLSPVPFLVPPTWNKGQQYKAVSTVWASAAAELGEAESIFVIGYSLPESDSFFRYLYALGVVGESPLGRFWVFNPDQAVKPRFESLLGPGAKARFRFDTVAFDDATRIISAEFPLQ